MEMDIERQVQDLAERVAVLEAALVASAPAGSLTVPPGAVPNQPPPPGSGAPLGPPVGPPTRVGPMIKRRARVFQWGIESVLRWAGVALVTLAGIFLVSTAVSRGWIGPELQLLGAALGGAILLGGAVRLAESRRPWAVAFGSGGAIVLIASALATHEWLDILNPGPAVALAAIAVVGAIAVALRTRIEGIALVAGVVGMVAPLDTLDWFGDGATLAWVAVFIIGAAALGVANQWPGVRMIIGWLGAFILMVYAQSEDAEGLLRVMGYLGAAVIGTTLWLSPTVAERAGRGSTPGGPGRWGSFDWTPVDYRLVALVPAWVTLVVAGLMSLSENTHTGIVAIATAAGFIGLVEPTYGRVPRSVSLATLLGSSALLAVGLAVYFDGPALMVALAGQAATSYFLSRRLDDLPLLVSSYVVGAASSLLAVDSMARAVDLDGFDGFGHGLATALVVLCWVGAAAASRLTAQEGSFQITFVGAWIGLMLWFAAALTGAPQGLVLISVAWTMMACTGLVVGLTRRIALVKNVALGTLALTLAKLVTVDLAEVEVFWRVGLFFVIGIGLIMLGLKVPSLIAPTNGLTDDLGDRDDSVTTF